MWNGEEEYPPVITVFSAPNYCGGKNKAAVIISELHEDLDLKVYTEKKDKPVLVPCPNNYANEKLDAFTAFHGQILANAYDFLT